MEYVLFKLKGGQQPPDGSTGVVLSNGYTVWIGEDGTFPQNAKLGRILSSDNVPETAYRNRLATEEEIAEYNTILNKKSTEDEIADLKAEIAAMKIDIAAMKDQITALQS